MQNFQKNITKYNQILLAIGGTLALLFIIAIGAFILLEEIARMGFGSDRVTQEGVIATQKTEELLADSLRKQIISFNNVTLLDSATSTYLLPVRQATLKRSETIDYEDNLNHMIGTSRRKEYGYNKGITVFNNLVVYQSTTNTSDIIFSERVSIKNYQIVKQQSQQYLLSIGTRKDTNKDKFLNPKDLQELFVYPLTSKQLTSIPIPPTATILSVFEKEKTTDLFVQIGIDKNNNGQFEQWKEPILFYKLDLPSLSLIQLVSEEQVGQLQRLLEGR